MINIRNIIILNKNDLRKDLITLAMPTVIEQILIALMSYVDTAMVGQLGAEATTAVSTTTTIIWLIEGIISAIGVVLAVSISKNIGNQEIDKVRKISQQCLIMSLLTGLILGILCLLISPILPIIMGIEKSIRKTSMIYFAIISIPMVFKCMTMILGGCIQATTDTKTPLKISILTNIINVILNIIFIKVLELGVAGAAIGSAISHIISGTITLYKYRYNMYLYFSWKDFKKDKNFLINSFKMSLPILGTNTASCLGTVIFTSLVARLGTVDFAAHSIALSIETLFIVPSFGLRTAISTSISTLAGEGFKKKIDVVKDVSLEVTLVVMLICSTIMFCVGVPLASIFTSDLTVAEESGKLLRLIAFFEIFYGLTMSLEGIFYGLEKTKYTLIVETAVMCCFRIPATYICINILHTGLTAVWWCMAIDMILKAVIISIPVLTGKILKD